MSTTPLWVPLVVAGVGVLGTLAGGIAGGLLTQQWADRRDDKTWARERVREQERWRREDKARTFEHRREVFEDFYSAHWSCWPSWGFGRLAGCCSVTPGRSGSAGCCWLGGATPTA